MYPRRRTHTNCRGQIQQFANRKNLQNVGAKEVTNFLSSSFDLYGIPDKIKFEKGGTFISKKYRDICKSRNIEIEFCTPRKHTGNGTVERAIQTLKYLVIGNMEDRKNLAESVNRALRVIRFPVHTGSKRTPFALHHRRKPRTGQTNIIKDGKTFFSNWSEFFISAPKSIIMWP